MGFRSLVSFGFLILPIAVTLSVLLGLQAFRESRGMPPPFVSHAIEMATYCQRAFGIHPPTQGLEYTLNPNQWGVAEDYNGPGALCMNVSTFANATYPTNTTAPEWSITWSFPPGPETQPVHAFPNIKLDTSNTFPVQISKVSVIDFATEWHYGIGDDKPNNTNVNDLNSVDLNSNVAIDMFLDADPTKATNSSSAKYEVMVWFAVFGPATEPIGLRQGSLKTETVNGTTFNLYTGVNGVGQSVLSWVAQSTVQEFEGDLGPLLQGLTGLGGPTTDDYLGYLAFGSEALSASSNVTFWNPDLRLQILST
ncbi:hypothetical protein PV10_05445 [Exophiala mesophila]|uniref:xyloglucan-specific endo-beta-1,4-glucanase n=1 Tax=Exophiala mesophila TaxID=212818 RepID=A0A0D1Z7S0_EXOME|nr:uncharacterized protein PV10_05445 [Exophiala mesophila]KIV90837.1 hypothetical protein PV10_05445 [Exophiala mesophila]